MGAWDAYIGGCATGDPDFMNYGMVHGENPFADNGNETGPFAVYNILYQAVSQAVSYTHLDVYKRQMYLL